MQGRENKKLVNSKNGQKPQKPPGDKQKPLGNNNNNNKKHMQKP